MTTPAVPTPDLSFIIPEKYKTVATLIGTGLSFAVPYILAWTDTLPQPWPAVVGVVLWILTVLGVYHAPYKPEGTVLAPETVIAHDGGQQVVIPPRPPAGGEYKNPFL